MTIPTQAAEAGKRADELIRQQAGKTPEDEPSGVAPGSAADNPNQPPDSAGPDTPPNRSEENWETRYRVLEGKYRKEVPDLQRQLRDSETRFADLLAEYSALQRETSGKKGGETVAPGATAPLNPDAFADYGEEFQELVRKLQQSQQELADTKTELATIKGQVGDVSNRQANTAAQTFEARLDQALPQWRKWNEDPDWVAWLGEPEAASGIVRQTILDRAGELRDVTRVVKLFQLWRQDRGLDTPEQQGKGKASASKTNKSLEKHVVPGGDRGGEPQAPGKRIWTRREIKDFYRKKSSGGYSGRDGEAAAIEQDILTAAPEGRVRD